MSHNAMSASIGVERRRQIVRRHPFAALVAIVGLALSAPASSLALPPGRHYEMVSPVFKGGFGAANIYAVSPYGESVAFYSAGVFNGDPSAGYRGEFPDYLARRVSSGWSTVPLSAPASLSYNMSEDFSPDLSLELSVGSPNAHEFEPRERLDTWLRATALPDTPESWQPTSIPTGILSVEGEIELEYRRSSADLCHAFLTARTGQQLYQLDRGCYGERPGIERVSLNNSGKLISGENCKVNIGDEYYMRAPTSYNAVSADGSQVFFTDCPVEPGGLGDLEAKHHQLFVRLGGKRTLEVSRPLEAGQFGGCVGETGGEPGEVPCKGATIRAAADFRGASEDGSKVYFTAPLEKGQAPLVSGDTDESTNLYMAQIGCVQSNPGCGASEREVTSLTEVSQDPNAGGVAEVQGVLRVAPDGQRVYFVASGDLLTAEQRQALEGEGRPSPQVGAANLYVYDSAAGVVSYVADLCTGTERSGMAEDFRCPSGESDERLWTNGAQTAGESQTGGSGGEFLVFSTYAQLTGEDTNAARDVYRFDALAGTLTRVSHGENGYEPNGSSGVLGSGIAQGHLSGEDFEQHQLGVRAVSEDGSRIVFTSSEPLSPADTNGLVNAYEWHGGAVSLVSTGSDFEGVSDVVISADGSSVAFVTVQGLVPQDTDGLGDVYVARLGEGFSPVPAERKPCEGDGCQGPLTNPAPLLVPGSVSQAPGENVPAPPANTKPKASAKPKCKRGQVRDRRRRCVKRKRKRKGRRARASRRSGNSSNMGGRL